MAAVLLPSGRRYGNSPALRRADRARARFALALTASVLVHGWLVTGAVLEAPVPPAPQFPTVLTARLEPAQAVPPSGLDLQQQTVSPLPAPRQASTARRPARLQHKAQAGEDAAAASQPRDAPVPAPTPPPATDPTYYSVRELDVYPAPLTSLAFGYPERAARGEVRGRVSVMLLIDAAGAVDDVTVVAAEPPGVFEDAVRAVLAAARFSPARRNGQAVRSRLTISVDYDPGALRQER